MGRGINQPTAWIISIILSMLIFSTVVYMIVKFSEKQTEERLMEMERIEESSEYPMGERVIRADDHDVKEELEKKAPGVGGHDEH
jgi:hypothetical protein